MNTFNIIGPAMIGPSNPYTAGACRIGHVTSKLVGGTRIVRMCIQPSGSFTCAYQGHGIDRVTLAGIFGYYNWSEELRGSMHIAAERSLSYEFMPEGILDMRPSTARVYYERDNDKQGMIKGTGIGGGNIQITNIDGMEVNFIGDNSTFLILYLNHPDMITAVTHLIYEKCGDLNIGNPHPSRKEKGGEVLVILELDQMPPESVIENLNSIKNAECAILTRTFG